MQFNFESFIESFQSQAEKRSAKKKDNNNICNELVTAITNENALTQKSLVAKAAEAGVAVSQPTVSRLLKKLSITRKRLSLVPVERNTPNAIQGRQVFGQMIRQIPDDRLVFLDETGFNLHTSMYYGYSFKNSKAFKTVPANRGRNVSVLCAIDVNGIVGYKILQGSFDANSFKNFMCELITMNPELRQKIFVMDNAKIHHAVIFKMWINQENLGIRYHIVHN